MISKICLYDEPTVPEIQIKRLAEFLKNKFSIDVTIQDNIFCDMSDNMAKELASIKIFKPKIPFERHTPSAEEIMLEKTNATNMQNITYYDGFEMQKIISKVIPKEHNDAKCFHVIFTSRLTCTFDYNDYRYHGRALIGANPSIISTTGIIEAPAKPREYYVDLLTSMTQGMNMDSIKTKYTGEYLEYHDKRLSKVIEGYLLQALFYHARGEAFCNSKECRLYNAHWQKDLIYSQLESAKLCQKHQNMLDNLMT